MNGRIYLFSAVLIIFTVIGLLIFLRPTYSAIEKRNLSEFPKFTLSSFLDGSYFTGISTWYADTFPMRENLLSANAKFESYFGLRTEEFVGGGGVADDIPDSYVPSTEKDTEKQTEKNDHPDETDAHQTAAQTETESQTQTETETESETYADGAIHVKPDQFGSIYITGGRAFSVCYFNLSSSNRYIEALNHVAERLDGKAQVYDILAPTSVGVGLDLDMQKAIDSSNQQEIFDYIYNALDPRIKKVEVLQTLIHHNTEYLYFNTDHHWTALGAYYAYTEFCKAKGIEAHPLDYFETMEFDGFLGSFYSNSGQSESLRNNPDTVIAYLPHGTNDLVFVDNKGQQIAWNVIYDVSYYDRGAKYSCFVAGDQVYASIHNPEITDGSSCAVVKESYGNAFIPFLVDHYEYVHILDYRYFNRNIPDFVIEQGIQDLIIINNTEAIGSDTRTSEIWNILQ